MSNPEVIRDKSTMLSWSRSRRINGETLALIPTMGFLHEGHLSLIRTAKTLADLTVVSIYLNPGQFSPSEDLSTYPSDFSGDLRKLSDVGTSAVFCPDELYDSSLDDVVVGHETWIRVERLERGMCGKSRPVFFRGVATVVAKLFNIVEPDVAVFGKKDYQQWRVVCRMLSDAGAGVVLCPDELYDSSYGNGVVGHETWIRVERLEKGMCGNSRPVFFRGVATVVAKLFNIVEPDVAVFGKKDYQQ